MGDDPVTTGQVPEVQIVECTGSSGGIRLEWRGKRTALIAYNANAAAVAAALGALDEVGTVTVTMAGGSTLCDADGVSTAITFDHAGGNHPAMGIFNELSGTNSVSLVHGSGSGVSS